MNRIQEVLSRKYAQAFLNCFIDDISLEGLSALHALELFLRTHQKVLFFLSLSHINVQIKKQFLKELFEKFKVTDSLNKLAHVLVDSKRGQLLYTVLQQIITMYKQRRQIASFAIEASHPLTESQIEIIQQFLARMLGCDIIYEYTIKKALIAGIRLQSDTQLWEYSIDKQLDSMSHQSTP